MKEIHGSLLTYLTYLNLLSTILITSFFDE
jgi:hypothetical protein